MNVNERVIWFGPPDKIPQGWTVAEDMPVIGRTGFWGRMPWRLARLWRWLTPPRCQGCGERGTELEDGFCGYCADD